MSNRNGTNSRNPVLVYFTRVVVEVLHSSLRDEEGLFVIGKIEVRGVFFPLFDDIFVGETLVGGWRIANFGEGNRKRGEKIFGKIHLIFLNYKDYRDIR